MRTSSTSGTTSTSRRPNDSSNRDVLAAKSDAIKDLVRTRLKLFADGRPLEGEWSAPEPLPDRQSIQIGARFPIGRPAGTVSVTALMFPYDPVHQTFVNFSERGAIMTQAILDRARTSVEYFPGTRQGVWVLMSRFVAQGFRHMLTGPEHLVFLFGLLLLGGSPRHLALLVTAFTAAQALTLSLAAFNIMTPSLKFVEPGIALSIIYIGADNLMVRGGRDMRAWIAAAFGFIHGFGFAGVLRAMDLSRAATGWSVASFNVGVEIGQLLLVAALAALLQALRARSELGRQTAGLSRLDCRYRCWYTLVRSTRLFSWRPDMKRALMLGLLLATGVLSIAVSAYQQPPPVAARHGRRSRKAQRQSVRAQGRWRQHRGLRDDQRRDGRRRQESRAGARQSSPRSRN